MIEITLALGAAKKAFDLIQSAIDTGQQASGLMDQLGNFYDAKDKVQEAKEDQKMLRVRTEERDRRELAKRELLKLQREKLKRQQEAKNLIIALFALAMCAGSAIYIAAIAVG